MVNVYLVIWLLFVHFIADFVCQSDEVAIHKSKGILYLLAHSFTYFFVLVGGYVVYVQVHPMMIPGWEIWWNLPAHIIIDGITSRINAKLYQNHRHWFFLCIGFDQFLHTSILVLTII